MASLSLEMPKGEYTQSLLHDGKVVSSHPCLKCSQKHSSFCNEVAAFLVYRSDFSSRGRRKERKEKEKEGGGKRERGKRDEKEKKRGAAFFPLPEHRSSATPQSFHE